MTASDAAMPFTGADLRSDDFVRKFSTFLTDSGVIDELAARRAERAQKQSGERFDFVLSRLGLVSESELVRHVARFFSIPLAHPDRFPRAGLFVQQVDAAFLRANMLLPVEVGPDGVVLAVADPLSGDAAAAFSYLVGQPVTIELAARKDIELAIERLYEGGDGHQAAAVSGGGHDAAHDEDVRQLADLGSEAPVIRLVNNIITRAAEILASDIHIEPREDSLVVRFRIDGVLQTVEQLPPNLRAAVTSRIKIMARLNIAEQRLPQDGRIRTAVRGRELDLRVSTIPTLRGESVVLRLLDRSSVALDFSSLGFSADARMDLEALLKEPNGIILVTGPTGSGKTTTLYAALETLNDPGRKIFTVEDPIEYQMTGINQIQIQPRIGLTFAAALRSILRQDPDVILVGEMRDLETAEVAIQASLTGHLVLSTVHTNSAAATITRLTDMGVEPYLLTSSLKGILAQRLVRRVCLQCAEIAGNSSVAAEKVRQLAAAAGEAQPDASHVVTAKGCEACRNTGYSGRTTIGELMLINEDIRRAILSRASESQLNEAGRANGMTNMFANGLEKVLSGETTMEEVMRAVRSD